MRTDSRREIVQGEMVGRQFDKKLCTQGLWLPHLNYMTVRPKNLKSSETLCSKLLCFISKVLITDEGATERLWNRHVVYHFQYSDFSALL